MTVLRASVRRDLCLLGVALLLWGVVPGPASALTLTEPNLITLLEATRVDLASLGLFCGDDPETALDGFGHFTETGWDWTLPETTYRGRSLALAYSGAYDDESQTVAWSGSGHYGTDPWSSDGTSRLVSDTEIDWDQEGQLGERSDSFRLIGGFGCTFGAGGTHWHGLYGIQYTREQTDISFTAYGYWDQATQETYTYTSLSRFPFSFSHETTHEGETDDDEITGHSYNRTTPEPSPLILLAAGGGLCLGAAVWARRRRTRA